MKHMFARFLGGLFLVSLLGGSAWAQQPRIATIDLRKCFDQYWKKKQAEAQLKERQDDIRKEDKNLKDEFKRLNEEYQTLLSGANEAALSQEEKDKRKRDAGEKLRKLQDLELQIRQYEETASTTLKEQTDRMRNNILTDIRNIVTAKAKAAGFTFVIDTAAESINQTPVFLYSSNENDITEAVLLELNKNAPTEVPKTEEKPVPDDRKKDGKNK